MFEQYQSELRHEEQEVHSYRSLEASRLHSLALLGILPDYKKIEMAAKCVDQELQLQESIRKLSYSDGELLAKLRQSLGMVFGYSTVLAAAAFVIVPAIVRLTGGTVSTEEYAANLKFVQWALTLGAVPVITYAFQRRKR